MLSASSWGCELKYNPAYNIGMPSSVSLLVRLWVEMELKSRRTNRQMVSLLVRLWVEMPRLSRNFWTDNCQPPREAVSWNCSPLWQGHWLLRQPPREAVSWNTYNSSIRYIFSRQPPREAVSWNANYIIHLPMCVVSLLVRLWVEILSRLKIAKSSPSASSWGCELKYTDYTSEYSR